MEKQISSPCIRMCRLRNDTCQGCGRSRREISRWTRMGDAEREKIMNRFEISREKKEKA